MEAVVYCYPTGWFSYVLLFKMFIPSVFFIKCALFAIDTTALHGVVKEAKKGLKNFKLKS